MILIDKILVDTEVANANFSCDLKQCKGACCTFPGEYGAPLQEDELWQIENSVEAAKEYLSERSLKILETEGFSTKMEGDLYTNCIDKKDCVFVFYDENEVAKCALEKAYYDGKTKFKKPLSCHLFPIRVGSFGGKYLYYEKIKECSPGVAKGNAEGVKMVEALKEPLTRAFGKNFYDKLDASVKTK